MGLEGTLFSGLKSLNSLQQSRASVCRRTVYGFSRAQSRLGTAPRESIPQFIVHRDATRQQTTLAVCLTTLQSVCLRKEPRCSSVSFSFPFPPLSIFFVPRPSSFFPRLFFSEDLDPVAPKVKIQSHENKRRTNNLQSQLLLSHFIKK